MSSDLLFPILPREGKIPVTSDERVKPVSKGRGTKELGEEERALYDEERKVSEQEVYKEHGKPIDGDEEKQQGKDSSAQNKQAGKQDSEDVSPNDDQSDGQQHVDTFA